MKKKFFLLSLIAIMNIGSIQQSQAVIGTVMALTGNGAAPALAMTGLATITLGHLADNGTRSGEWSNLYLTVLGVVLLENNGIPEIQLEEVTEEELERAGLTSQQINDLIWNKDELVSIFNASMMYDETVEEASERFNKAKTIYGQDAIEGLYKYLSSKK